MKYVLEVGIVQRLAAKLYYHRAKSLAARTHTAAAHRLFVKAARLSHVEALYQVGLNYSCGRGCTRSGSEALRWFELAAGARHPGAQFELGIALLTDHDLAWSAGTSARWAKGSLEIAGRSALDVFPGGLSFSKNSEKAYSLLYQAAEAGKPEAQANLGWLLLKGIGCNRDPVAAEKWLRTAAEHNLSQAALGLAEIFGDENNPSFSPAERKIWLRRAAELGNSSAAFQLGLELRREAVTDAESDASEHYLRIAADKGHAGACYELGAIHLKRSADETQAERAAEYLRSAAKGGHISAAVLLGELFCRGEKLRRDFRESAQWFRRAADAGHIQAQFQIGCFFARGEGVPNDYKHAARYFEMSAVGGHLIGALNIGIFYEIGQGVEQDLEKAIHWLRFAAEGGIPQAQVRLAHLLNSGRAGVRDRGSAFALFEMAAKHNNAEAEFALAQILMADQNDDNRGRINDLLTRAINKGHIGAAELALHRSAGEDESLKAAKAAVELLQEGAKSQRPAAMVLLALELLRGRYLTADPVQAESLLSTAADTQDPTANFELGVFYCKRNNNRSDIANGLRYYTRAAELGHALAQFNAGLMLLNGIGADRDILEATRHLSNAAAQGIDKAKIALATLEGAQVRNTPIGVALR